MAKTSAKLKEAVQDVSPVKRYCPNLHDDGVLSDVDGKLPVGNAHARKQIFSNQYYTESAFQNEPTFTLSQTRTMKGLLNSINNILKQSAGRRWVYYEWFYSNIDRTLLLGENDFQNCLHQLFKDIKLKNLTRVQWSMIRRLMGKPRRCSAAFFEQERCSLEKKRKKIRYLHQLKGFEVTDMSQFKELPEEIPMPMVIGTKVTAKVYPDGDDLRLFTGTVDAVDNVNNTFRISFDREGIGTHSIGDVEVASEDYEAMNLQLFIVKERPKIAGASSPPDVLLCSGKQANDNTLNSMPPRIRLSEAINSDLSGTYGGFPVRFLLYLTKLSKIIALKKKFIDRLKEMNSEVEIRKPYKEGVNKELQKNYAFIVLELEKINQEMNTTFYNIHDFMNTVAPQLGLIDQSGAMKQYCDSSAMELVEKSHRIVESERMKELVTNMTSLMLQVNCYAEMDKGHIDLSSIDSAIKDLKGKLCKENKSIFEDKVETNIAFIKNGLQEGESMLSAFNNGCKSSKKFPAVTYSSEDENQDELEIEDDEENSLKGDEDEL